MTKEALLKQIPSPETETKCDARSEVSSIYQDRVVFITGGTGFIGQVLLEKLLRSCPVKRIYLLVRSKRGVEAEARIEELFKCEVLQRLKRDIPGARSKVAAVRGDLALPYLGLSKTDMAIIIAEVSVVFHLAATVMFHDSLKRVVQLNVMGTRSMVDICRQMPNLCAFVHVSTAYISWGRREVQEMVYPAPIDAESLIEITESLGEKAVESMSDLQFGQPNNYALSKAVTESLLLDKQRELPLAIVRPSIVTASWKEPLPGWIDNYKACTGIAVSISMGLLPSLLLSKDCVADLIPVDVVANTLICIAWKVASTSFVAKYRKAISGMDATSFYTTNSWIFRSDNVMELMNDMSPTDKQLFDIDVRKLDWCQYWDNYMLGIRKYLFKVEDTELQQGRENV
ncbi:fatty acyl-CoA reductase 1-like isoform X2 [Dermacentor variabilis]|uniref:fatty acyl-CoA reductase 1-like isoform X2 n=1 Tax=Dermacentor variabilis TaxID=34621 RepID=UPI003F5C15E1